MTYKGLLHLQSYEFFVEIMAAIFEFEDIEKQKYDSLIQSHKTIGKRLIYAGFNINGDEQ